MHHSARTTVICMTKTKRVTRFRGHWQGKAIAKWLATHGHANEDFTFQHTTRREGWKETVYIFPRRRYCVYTGAETIV